MRRQASRTTFLFSLAALLLATPAQLLAYVDPGSGSFFLQMLIAGLLGASMTIKTFWKQIKSYFSRGGSSTDE